MQLGKLFMVLGVIFFGIGLYFYLGGRLNFLGQLPGDLHWRWGGASFYFPVVTCALISLLATVLLNFLFKR